jgi:predicted nucleic acid-binding protein
VDNFEGGRQQRYRSFTLTDTVGVRSNEEWPWVRHATQMYEAAHGVDAFLVDNSVLQRLARSAKIQAAVGELEAGFSARSHSSHQEIVRRLTHSFELLPMTEEVGAVAVEFQDAWWRAGTGRAAGFVDLLHAATAVANDAVVLHSDSDFDHLAKVDRRVRAQWIDSAGSVP